MTLTASCRPSMSAWSRSTDCSMPNIRPYNPTHAPRDPNHPANHRNAHSEHGFQFGHHGGPLRRKLLNSMDQPTRADSYPVTYHKLDIHEVNAIRRLVSIGQSWPPNGRITGSLVSHIPNEGSG